MSNLSDCGKGIENPVVAKSDTNNQRTDLGSVIQSQHSTSGNSSNCLRPTGDTFGIESFKGGEGYIEESKRPDVGSFSNCLSTGAGEVIPTSSHHVAGTDGFSSDGIDELGIANDDNDKHLSLRFSIPIPQAGPRPTSSIHGSVYSTPGTFSISSRGCTSTAPSTPPSTCSLNSENSLNEKGTAGSLCSTNGSKAKNQNQVGNLSNPSALQMKQPVSTQGFSPSISHSELPTTSATSSSNPTSSTSSNGANDNNNVDRIDSALLSALCDPREKYGLLRLEQTLIDFMNERATGYIEVGGPNNSIVIGGQSGGRLANTLSNGGSPNNTNVSIGVDNEGKLGKQTSFQRLCLHRLADRFNIVRESASNASSWIGGASPLPVISGEDVRPHASLGPSVPGLIRLVKVKNSRIPTNLLIELDVESYQHSGPVCVSPRNGESHSGLGLNEKSSDSVTELTNMFGASSLENKSSVTFVKKQNSQPRKKMMIMKRNNGSSGSLKSNNSKDRKNGNKKNRNNLRGKNFNDKEKAYAEARARIFNESASSSENGESQEKICRDGDGTGSEVQPSVGFASAFRQVSASPTSSAAPSEVEEDPDPFCRVLGNQALMSEKAEEEYENGSASASRPRDFQNNHAAASTKSTAGSKVTWRNRRQEENDPDFWRGFNRNVGVHPQYSYGPSTSAQAYLNGGSANVQTNGYPNHGIIPQQHHNPQVFYPTGPHSRLQYNANNGASGGHYTHGIQHSQSQQSANYYASNTQANSYYSQQQHHQLRQNYHNISNGGANSFVTSSANSHVGMYVNADDVSGSTNSAAARRTGNILYNMEEFPALR